MSDGERSFKYRENELRQGAYRKDVSEERFLDALNDQLVSLEPDGDLSAGKPEPLIVILGLPRSGTTLLSQLLGHALEVAVVNNLAARFWLAPVTGMRLSRILLGDTLETRFQSDYGKTGNISEPHEFSYFWHHWFRMDGMPPYDPNAVREAIDWGGLRRTLRNMAAVAGKPLVLKSPDVGYHLAAFARELPESIFLLSRRDLADVAISILNSRRLYFQNEDTWIGQYPVEYERIQHLPGRDQVVAQVVHLEAMFLKGLTEIPSARARIVDLETLCASPVDTVREVQRRVASQTFGMLRDRAAPPRGFEFSTHRHTPDYEDFEKRIESYRAEWAP